MLKLEERIGELEKGKDGTDGDADVRAENEQLKTQLNEVNSKLQAEEEKGAKEILQVSACM